MWRQALAWWMTMLAVMAAALVVAWAERRRASEAVTLFSATQRGCLIVIPADAVPAERRAAELVQATLAGAAGGTAADFPIGPETWPMTRRALLVGATHRGNDIFGRARKPPHDTAVGWRVRGGSVFVRSERRDSIESAAGWFLE